MSEFVKNFHTLLKNFIICQNLSDFVKLFWYFKKVSQFVKRSWFWKKKCQTFLEFVKIPIRGWCQSAIAHSELYWPCRANNVFWKCIVALWAKFNIFILYCCRYVIQAGSWAPCRSIVVATTFISSALSLCKLSGVSVLWHPHKGIQAKRAALLQQSRHPELSIEYFWGFIVHLRPTRSAGRVKKRCFKTLESSKALYFHQRS